MDHFPVAYRIFADIIWKGMLKVYYLKIADWQNLSDEYLFHRVEEDTVRQVLQYRNKQVRRTKLLGESMVRHLLLRLWGLRKTDFQICKGQHGKPLVENNSSVWFNLSHSGDYIVAAFSHLEVGVDIERKSKSRMEVARRFFHPSEISCLMNLPEEKQHDLFFRYWSVKESFLKYTGSGLSSPLSGFEVRFENKQTMIFKENKCLSLQIRECPIDEAYACFVCSEAVETPEIKEFCTFD